MSKRDPSVKRTEKEGNFKSVMSPCEAMRYVEGGWFIFPVKPGQKAPPLVNWRTESTSDSSQIKAWWVRWPYANIGLDCGKSGLIVIDVDTRDCGMQHWVDLLEEHGISQDTLTVSTPSGGLHIYYGAPESQIGNSSALSHLGIDVRGNGGYVLLPSSRLENGESYIVENDTDIIPMPEALREILETKSDPPIVGDPESQSIPKGQRDTTLTSLAGSMRRRGMSPEAIEAALLTENANRCQPPLEEKQVIKIAGSISKKPPGKINSEIKKSADTQAAKLINFGSELVLFHDQNKQAMVFIDGEAVPLKSRKIKQWLAKKFYQNESKPPQPESLKQAILTLEGKAIFDGPEHALHNRIAKSEGAFWYDLGEGKAVRIRPDRWDITNAPILFRRYAHQQVQNHPVADGDPRGLFNFINIPESERILLLATIISYFIPEIAHPVIHPHGPHGSGKTSLLKIIKKLCDPSNIDVVITPRNQMELVQVLDHHHFCPFDNLSELPSWMSDILCQVCTGGGFSKRQLFTDDDDIIFQLKRCIGLNGINLLISKPDLLDRSILIYLNRIDPKNRLEERDIWERFEKAKPSILGGIFDALSQAMAIYPSVRLPYLPRMADFGRWAYAIAESLGAGGQVLLGAYQRNVNSQNEEVIQSNTLAQAVLSLMSDKETWNGSIKQAHHELKEIATPDKKDPTFPKTNRTLRKHLERIRANLIDYGITYSIGERTSDGYPIRFRKTENFGSFASFDTQALIDKDLADEPNVNQSEANRQAVLFDSSLNPLKGNISELNERNEANFQALGEQTENPPGRFDHLPPDLREKVEERASIMEFDGGLSREEAETRALILAGEPT